MSLRISGNFINGYLQR